MMATASTFIAQRLAKLRRFLRGHGHGAAIVSKPANVRYFSGFSGEDSALVISGRNKLLVTDARYSEQARQEAPDCALVEQRKGLWVAVAEQLKRGRWRDVIFEGNHLTFDSVAKLTELLPASCTLTSLPLDRLRVIKDEWELAQIRRACEIADAAFADILAFIRAGVSEREVAARLELAMRRLGSERPAFETIVASGVRGALPHGAASDKIIESGELVTMDFGATVNGYCSDITRTVAVGKIGDGQRALSRPPAAAVYGAVLAAQRLGVGLVKPGANPRTIDKAVRQFLHDHGSLDKKFTHGLGHCVGLEIHEEPRLSSRERDCKALLPGMVVTVEPGVYLAGEFGVRIEDTVAVTADGCERLTKSGRELQIIGKD